MCSDSASWVTVRERIQSRINVIHITSPLERIEEEDLRGQTDKALIPREQFPRSILVAKVMTMLLTCYEEIGCVTSMLTTFRTSQHVEIVWHVTNVPATHRTNGQHSYC